MNKTLVTLDISSNRLDKTSCPHLRDMLRMSGKLENLNIACNHLGQDGGKILLEGVKMSRLIKRVSTLFHNRLTIIFACTLTFKLNTLRPLILRLHGCII